jgi:hypothetical protein
MAWTATFSELLVLHLSQALVVIAFVTLARRNQVAWGSASSDDRASRRLRFSLRELLILPAIFAGILGGAEFLDSPGIRPVLITPYWRINFWLPILGCATGVATLFFALSYQAQGRRRLGRLALSVLGTAVLGWGLASAYPLAPVLWSTYIGSYAPGAFRYFRHAYVVWLPLLGVVTVVTLALCRAAARRGPVLVARLAARSH